MNCSGAAERSFGSDARRLAMNSPGVIAPIMRMRTRNRSVGNRQRMAMLQRVSE